MYSDYVLKFLETNTRLMEIIPDIDNFMNDNILIKGAVQSGKTKLICALCLYINSILKKNIIIILRNFSDDAFQFQRGIQSFLSEYHSFMEKNNQTFIYPYIHYTGNIIKKRTNQYIGINKLLDHYKNNNLISITLANSDQISKLNYCIDSIKNNNFTLIFDEVDQLMYSNGDILKLKLDHLKNVSNQIIGISATMFETILDSKFNTHHTFIMIPPIDYKGITKINYQFINKYKGSSIHDKCLLSFLDKDNSMINEHPFIVMIKTERKINDQNKLMSFLQSKYNKKYTIITYNGDNIKLYNYQLNKQDSITLQNKKKSKKKGDYYFFKKCPLPFVLQYLKELSGVERIIIISHGLVGRGINIVSLDFQWHLTHMFYRPSKTTTIESMIQSIRLCGIYQDNIPLTCLIEKENYESLYKGFQLQEDVFKRIQNSQELLKLDNFMEKQKIFKEKIPKQLKKKFKPYVTNKKEEDQGMNMNQFDELKYENNLIPLIDDKEYDRLTNDKNGMFKKWSIITNQSNIARFMREGLEPTRQYSKKEYENLCKSYNIQKAHIMKVGTHYIGLLFIEYSKNNFIFHPKLVEKFYQYF